MSVIGFEIIKNGITSKASSEEYILCIKSSKFSENNLSCVIAFVKTESVDDILLHLKSTITI